MQVQPQQTSAKHKGKLAHQFCTRQPADSSATAFCKGRRRRFVFSVPPFPLLSGPYHAALLQSVFLRFVRPH